MPFPSGTHGPRITALLRKLECEQKRKEIAVRRAKEQAKRNSPQAIAKRRKCQNVLRRKRRRLQRIEKAGGLEAYLSKKNAMWCKRYRVRKAKAEREKRRAEIATERAAKLKAKQEREYAAELRKRKVAHADKGTLAGWHSTSELANPETWSRAYVGAFNEARAERAKLEAQFESLRSTQASPKSITL